MNSQNRALRLDILLQAFRWWSFQKKNALLSLAARTRQPITNKTI
jgi:hypothetical protein